MSKRLNIVGEYRATILVQDKAGRPQEFIGRGKRNIRRDIQLLRDEAIKDAIAQYAYKNGINLQGTDTIIKLQQRGIRTQIIEEKFTYETSKNKGINVREETRKTKTGKIITLKVARDKRGRIISSHKI